MNEFDLREGAQETLPDRRYFFSTVQVRRNYGGLTLAMLARARLFAAAGRKVEITTVDWWLGYDDLREQLVNDGLLTDGVSIRNLHEDLAACPDVRTLTSSFSKEPHALAVPRSFVLDDKPSYGGRKRYWSAPGEKSGPSFLDFLRPDGSLYMRTVVKPGVAEWQSPARPVGIYDGAGRYAFGFPSHQELWRFWARTLVQEQEISSFAVLDAEVEELLHMWESVGATAYKFIHVEHSTTDSSYGPLKDRWYPLLGGAKPFHGVVIPTMWQAQEWIERFGSVVDVRVVPHFPPAPAPLVPTENDRGASVVIVARLVRQKRIDDSLRVFARVLGEVPEARLDVYGDGPLKTELEAMAQDLGIQTAVTFHGHIPGGAAHFANASVALFTSQMEGFGLTTIEAMGRGAIPVAFDVRYGPSDIIVPGAGHLIGDRNVEEAASKVVELLRTSNSLVSQRAAAIARSLEFTADKTLRAWGELIESACQEGRPEGVAFLAGPSS